MAGLPGTEDAGDAPVFAEPWQAEVFAMAVTLSDAGLFSSGEWADALSAELARPGEPADGSGYYRAWTRALEALLSQKGVAGRDEIEATTQAWHRAAEATPHGRPILIENDPQRRGAGDRHAHARDDHSHGA